MRDQDEPPGVLVVGIAIEVPEGGNLSEPDIAQQVNQLSGPVESQGELDLVPPAVVDHDPPVVQASPVIGDGPALQQGQAVGAELIGIELYLIGLSS